MQNVQSDSRRLLSSDAIDEALDHSSQHEFFDDVAINDSILLVNQAYKNLLQVCVRPSLEVCADHVAANSCVAFKLFGYSFVIHKISRL